MIEYSPDWLKQELDTLLDFVFARHDYGDQRTDIRKMLDYAVESKLEHINRKARYNSTRTKIIDMVDQMIASEGTDEEVIRLRDKVINNEFSSYGARRQKL